MYSARNLARKKNVNLPRPARLAWWGAICNSQSFGFSSLLRAETANSKAAKPLDGFATFYSRNGRSATSSALLSDFRSCDWTIPVELQINKKAKFYRILQRSLAEILVAVPTLAAASIFARYITGDPSKPIDWWVIPAISASAILIIVGICLKIKLDETK
jgi:hypothetical protein